MEPTENLYYEEISMDNINLKEFNDIMEEAIKNDVFKYMLIDTDSPRETAVYVEGLELQKKRGLGESFLMKMRETDDIIGGVNYNKLTDEIATVGIWLRKKYWGQGFCKEGINQIIEYALTKGYQEIEIATHKDNKRAMKAFRKIVEDRNGQYIGINQEYKVGGKVVPSHVFRIR